MDFGTLIILGFGLGAVYYLLQQGPVWPVWPPATDYGLQPDVGTDQGGVVIMPTPQVDLESKVQQFAQAIAHAEGFGIAGAIPTTHHNPGDLGPGDTPGFKQTTFTDGSYVVQLPDDTTGWTLLTNKIRNAFMGRSGVYYPGMTILEWAHKYAGDWQNWANNVAAYLGVTPDTVIADWIAS